MVSGSASGIASALVPLGLFSAGEVWFPFFAAVGGFVGLGCRIGGKLRVNGQITKVVSDCTLASRIYAAAPGSDARASPWMACRLKEIRRKYMYIRDDWDSYILYGSFCHHACNFSLQWSGVQGLKYFLGMVLPNSVRRHEPVLSDIWECLSGTVQLGTQSIDAENTAEVVTGAVLTQTAIASGAVIGINILALVFYVLEFWRTDAKNRGLAEDLEQVAADFEHCFGDPETAAMQT